jgi:hypothetical protein
MTTFTTEDKNNALPKEGSVWWAGTREKFRVIHIVEQNNEIWVHYRNEPRGLVLEPVREYSCLVESFLSRFTLTPE